MGMLEIQFSKEKAHLQPCVDAFNTLCEQGEYPQIISYTYFQLYTKCPDITPAIWKEFLLDPTVTAWYNSERTLLLRSQANNLISNAGYSKSTAQAQVLSTLLKQINEQEAQGDNNKTMIIYTFVPLTEQELLSNNARESTTIPDSIKNATKIIRNNSIFDDEE